MFWQVLNDSVWLVNAIQGYDAIRDALSPQDRQTIESQVFRPMAEFLASEPKNYDQIHNHATWAVAATGMTGYVLRDRELVEKSLRGSRKDDQFGFLRQIDLLFSPDGITRKAPTTSAMRWRRSCCLPTRSNATSRSGRSSRAATACC